MKRLLFGLGLTLAGCGERVAAPTTETAQTPEVIARQLERGDGKACINPVVQNVIRAITFEPENLYRYSDWTADDRRTFEGGLDIRVEAITLGTVDPVAKLVTCTGTYVATYNGEGGDVAIAYEVQSTLDGGEPVVRIDNTTKTWNALLFAKQAFDDQRLAAKQARRDLVPISRNFDEARRVCQRSSSVSDGRVQYAINFLREVPQRPSDSFDGETWACMRNIAESGNSRRADPDSSPGREHARQEDPERQGLPEDRIESGIPPGRVDPSPALPRLALTESLPPPPAGRTFTPN